MFEKERHSVQYYGRVIKYKVVTRRGLFPEEPENESSDKKYFQIFIESLQVLPKPIYSRKFRRVVFIPTTWEKLISAVEINDLFDESSLEDKLWAEFKRKNIQAERQEYIKIDTEDYFLDFAVYCEKGNLDVETDGDFWHANPESAKKDNLRDNNLISKGWKILRFTSSQIHEEITSYCVPKITKTINTLGGLKEGRVVPRKINTDSKYIQPSLYDD